MVDTKYKVPDYVIESILDNVPLSEQIPKYVSLRGDWQKIREICNYGRDIKVGVGDTGVDKTHMQEGGDLENVVDAKDFTGSRFGFYDKNMHGSHCTGTITATNKNNNGIVGLTEAPVYHAKVLGDGGSGSSRGIAQGIDWMVAQGCKILSLSLGGGYDKAIEDACIRADKAGVIIFAAMGNSGGGERSETGGYPGRLKSTVAICAIDYNKNPANFSSRSKDADLTDYGVNTLSLSLNGKYARISGTSMATPCKAGIAALICNYELIRGNPVKNRVDYMKRIKPFVEDLYKEGFDRATGMGFFNIADYLEANPIEEKKPEPKPQPKPEPKKPEPTPVKPPVKAPVKKPGFFKQYVTLPLITLYFSSWLIGFFMARLLFLMTGK